MLNCAMRKLNRIVQNVFDHAEPNVGIVGIFSVFGYPFYYFIWVYVFPQPYESLTLRMICAVISLPCIFYKFSPISIKKFFPYYFFGAIFIASPFFFSFMFLKNECSVVWMMSMLAGIFILTLIVFDWLVICAMTGAGFLAAYVLLLLMDGHVSMSHFQPEYVPVILFSISGGILANHKQQLAHLSKVTLLKSLSGSIAHEMRNPLNSISNAIAAIYSKLPNKPVEDQVAENYSISTTKLVSIHSVIEESSNTLNRANKIIDSLLASMKGDEISTDSFVRVNASQAIEAAVNNFPYKNNKEKRLITVKKIQDFEFFGDRDLFFYVIFNLLKNSLHYKDKNGFRIEISINATSRVNTILVRDTGPGIPRAKRERIFESFYTSDKKNGNGLGLSFCRRVVSSFGGSIVCDSKVGEWTEFSITLPKYASKKVQEIKRNILKKKLILITDDHLANRIIIAKYLAEMHCDYHFAENGKIAAGLLSQNRYDLIFMDFEMPVLSGDSVVRFIRSATNIDPSLALHYLNVPIIGTTALPEVEAVRRAQNCGMNEVLAKPIKKSDVTRVLEAYFFSGNSLIKKDFKDVINGKLILLVDDNETSREFMSIVLKNYGCDVEQAVHGREAIELLEKRDFDLVLMDIEMPVMNGLEATKAIRSGKCFTRFTSYNKIPIIALTGNTDKQHSQDIKEAGMDYHLGKPVFKDELLSTIAVLLRNEKPREMTMCSDYNDKRGPKGALFWNTIEREKILDITTINNLKEIGGDELIESLFKTFIEDSNKLTNELANAVVSENIKHYDSIMHTLKGSSGSIGANRMYLLSVYINDFSHKGKWPDKDSWLEVLKRVYAETVTEMENFYQ